MRYVLALLIFATAVGCSRAPRPKVTNLDEAAARLSQLSGKPAGTYTATADDAGPNPDARMVTVPAAKAPRVVETLRQELNPGLIAFVGHVDLLAEPNADGSEVVVAKGTDQFDILRVAKSDAANYEKDTEDLIKRLKMFDEKYGIDIFHAEIDTVEFRLRSPPKHLKAFCKELYEFCPDIVEQGAGDLQTLEKEIARTQSVFLWWD